jgi:hypothetical protein
MNKSPNDGLKLQKNFDMERGLMKWGEWIPYRAVENFQKNISQTVFWMEN